LHHNIRSSVAGHGLTLCKTRISTNVVHRLETLDRVFVYLWGNLQSKRTLDVNTQLRRERAITN